jgi:methyl-accepting chemotaxis protein
MWEKGITDLGNNFIYNNGKITSTSSDEFISPELYNTVKQTKNEFIINPRNVEIDGEAYYLISEAQPIVVNGEFLGIIGIDMTTDLVQPIVDNGKLFDNGYACVSGENGILVAHPNPAVIGKGPSDLMPPEKASPMENAHASQTYYSVESTSASTGVLSLTSQATLEVGETGAIWGIVTSIPLNELGAGTIRATYVGIFLTVAFIIIIIVVLFLIATHFIAKPMNLSIDQIQEAAFHVTGAATQLNTSSHQLSEGSTEQAASIEETSATMDETSSMVQQNAENARQANDLSKSALLAAETGSSKMQGMTESMEELKKSSSEIAKIIKVIDEIAFQTNMLALNAAVEAARAGDAGQGFAVVAEEVRNLAQKSAKAANDTAEIIERNIQLSEHGAKTSDDVNISLSEIVEKVEKVNQLMNEVSVASQEQSNGVTQVTQAIGEMEKVVQQNAASAEETNASAEEMTAQAERLNEIVESLTLIVKGVKSKSSDKATASESMPVENERRSFEPKAKPVRSTEKSIISPNDVIPLDDDDDF